MTPSALRALMERATKAPWTYDRADELHPGRVEGIRSAPLDDEHGYDICQTDGGYYGPSEVDAELICATVNALPALLEVAEAAQDLSAAVYAADRADGVQLIEAHDAQQAALERARRALEKLGVTT